MKDRTNAPADRTNTPVKPRPGAPGVIVHKPVPLFQPREAVTEGDLPGDNDYQTAR
jgi:hypothetical protein